MADKAPAVDAIRRSVLSKNPRPEDSSKESAKGLTMKQPAEKSPAEASREMTMASGFSKQAQEQPSLKRRRTDSKDCQKEDAEPSHQGTTVFIGNLHPKIAQVHLEKLFSKYGSIVRIHVCFDKETGKHRGFAFCEFESQNEAEIAIQALHGQSLLKQNLTVRWAKQTNTAAPPTKASNRRTLDAKIKKLKQVLNDS